MISRITASWQLILADLALILFLVTLTALASANEEETDIRSAAIPADVNVPVQALYRPVEGIIPFADWLADQPSDPRAQLTIYASYRAADRDQTWQKVRSMASDAAESGVATKVVMVPGEHSDIYAKIGFDHPVQPGGTGEKQSHFTPQ